MLVSLPDLHVRFTDRSMAFIMYCISSVRAYFANLTWSVCRVQRDYFTTMPRYCAVQGGALSRKAAVHTLVLFIRYGHRGVVRVAAFDALVTNTRRGLSWWRRLSFLDAVGAVVWLFSRTYMKEKFLPLVLELLKDRIPNVRQRALQTLLGIRKWLVFPKVRTFSGSKLWCRLCSRACAVLGPCCV
jgi:hypothetical protein